jgi:hypothetical protein
MPDNTKVRAPGIECSTVVRQTIGHLLARLLTALSNGKYAATSAGSVTKTSRPVVAAKKPIHEGTLSDLRNQTQTQ